MLGKQHFAHTFPMQWCSTSGPQIHDISDHEVPPQIQEFDREDEVALNPPLLPNFQTQEEPHGLDDVALQARSCQCYGDSIRGHSAVGFSTQDRPVHHFTYLAFSFFCVGGFSERYLAGCGNAMRSQRIRK